MMTMVMVRMVGKLKTEAMLVQELTVLQEPGKLLMVLKAMVLMLVLMAVKVRVPGKLGTRLTVTMLGSTVAIKIKLKLAVGLTLLLMEIKVMESTLVATVVSLPVDGLMVVKTNLDLELDIKAPKVGETVTLVVILARKAGVAGVLVHMVLPKPVVTLTVVPLMVLIAMVNGPVKVTAILVPILQDNVPVNGVLEMLELLMPLLVRMVIFLAKQMVEALKMRMQMATVLHNKANLVALVEPLLLLVQLPAATKAIQVEMATPKVMVAEVVAVLQVLALVAMLVKEPLHLAVTPQVNTLVGFEVLLVAVLAMEVRLLRAMAVPMVLPVHLAILELLVEPMVVTVAPKAMVAMALANLAAMALAATELAS